jgi:hypothetical protein
MMSAQAAHAEAEESWFVAFGPNDVRTLSLEQLDDAYRLDVINEETLVCSTTMNNWVPLGVVVGSDAAEPQAVAQPVMAQSGHGGQQLFGRAPYEPPAYSPATYAAAPAYTQQSYAPTSVMPTSMAPAVYDIGPAIQYRYPTRRSWWGAPMVLLAFCAVAFGAFRLGAASQLAGSIGMKPQFAALTERVLGAPGIDTLEGVQAFINRLSTEYRLDDIQVLGDRLAGVSAIVGGNATNTTKQPVVAAIPESDPPAAAVEAPKTEPVATEAAMDINSLPRAEADAPAAAAAAAPVLASARVQRVAPPQPEEPKVTPGVLDTNAMRAALERSKKKAKKKDRFAKAAQFDPMNSTVE